MTLSKDDLLKTACSMLRITTNDIGHINADEIVQLCNVVAEAQEKLGKEISAYEGLSKEQIKENMKL